MAGGSSGDQRRRTLLSDLIGRVRDGRAIADLLAADVDADSVATELRLLTGDHVVIDSIAGNDKRIDAVVTSDDAHARVVFAHDEAGLVTWLHAYLKPSPFEAVPGGRVVVVNGPSGAGKSTLMGALQSVATFPLVVLDEPEQIGTVQPGYLIWRDSAPSLHSGYLAAIGALAGEGNLVALSAAGHPHHEIADAFRGTRLLCVGLRCDAGELQVREQRTGRWAGIAAESLGVHDGWTYDLEFDTTNRPNPLDLARRVLDLVEP